MRHLLCDLSARKFDPGRVAADRRGVARAANAWACGAVMFCAAMFSSLGLSVSRANEAAPSDFGKSKNVAAATDADVIAMIDQYIRQGWEDAGLTASAKATDGEWCRRVYLDLLGRIPDTAELNAFLNDRSADKRAKLVDRLLSDEYVEDYAKNWASIWSIRLVGRPPANNNNNRELTNRAGMQKYLRDSFLRNKPYNTMAFELISATGSTTPGEPNFNGAVNFLIGKLQENASEATARTAKYFLGLQVQCTQCHNHPFNDWKQEQYWSMNAFFRQTRSRANREERQIVSAELFNRDFRGEGSTPREAEIYYELRNGTMAVAYPTFVDGTRINPSGYVKEVNRREELARLVVNSEYFGKALANYMWGHFLGYGFTKPVDDMGPHNSASHPELLDRLGHEFAAQGHDLKKLIRWITLSEAYSLSSRMIKGKNDKDDPSLGERPKFSHFYLRQMQAEQLYESILVATGNHKGRGSYEEQESRKANWLRQFTVTFGNDEGDETTTFNGTIPQSLMMMNGDMMKNATNTGQGSYLSNLAGSVKTPTEALDRMYMSALARKPTSSEVAIARELGQLRPNDLMSVYQDIWWSILNSNEFIFVY